MSDLISDASRLRKTATTYFQKATATIRWLGEHENESVRAVGSWETERLLTPLLHEAETLVPFIGADEIDEVERAAKDLAHALRAHRLAGKLEQTSGRTPEETETYRQKAATLRGAANAAPEPPMYGHAYSLMPQWGDADHWNGSRVR